MSNFDFEVLTRTNYYKRHVERCVNNDNMRDLCTKKILKPNRDEYINIPQKSALWLKLRSLSHGTASSLGKFLPGDKFTDETALNTNWEDYLKHKPFEKTHTMEAHMKWGTTYEDLALMCFAEKYKVCVTQVGTIRVDFKDIHDNYVLYFPKLPELIKTQDEELEINEYHLLISPDGIVGNRDIENPDYNTLPDVLTGMLEIKCISPFDHVENIKGNLEWCKNMEKRQWTNVQDIPYVYLIQMCLQSLSGIIELDMSLRDTMYFQRWSPKGYSIFEIPFEYLFKIGILATELYFSILHRSKQQEENFVAYPLTDDEKLVADKMQYYIKLLNTKITHRYVNITNKHPYYDLFHNYYLLTRNTEFNMHPKVIEEEKGECLI